MATPSQAHARTGESDSARQLAVAANNIKTAADFARFMASLMAALVSGDIDHKTADSICKTANTLLKAVEMQAKFGNTNRAGQKILALTENEQPALPENVTSVTHVTSPAKPEPPKQPPATARLGAKPVNGGPWCTDHYVKHKQYIKATEEYDEDPLCLSCANQKRRDDDA
jgi:hypothetical protein